MTVFDEIPLKRISTAEQVTQGLMDLILRGALTPGASLRESAVATSLGVSRNTVREAIRLLEQSGLVRHELHRGAIVVEPSLEEVESLRKARHVLEVSAVASPPDAEGLARVQAAFDGLVSAAGQGDMVDIVARDLNFHGALVSLLGSARIDVFFEQVITELRFYLMVLSVAEREYERPEFVIEEHGHILDAVKAGDTELARTLVSEHIDSNMGRLRDLLLHRDEAAARPAH